MIELLQTDKEKGEFKGRNDKNSWKFKGNLCGHVLLRYRISQWHCQFICLMLRVRAKSSCH